MGPACASYATTCAGFVGAGTTEVALNALVATAMRRYSRYWLETFRLPKLDHVAIATAVQANTTGAEHVEPQSPRPGIRPRAAAHG